ncbi:MAG: hypothetical protein RLZZ58_1069 [Pseudomonadota bacterium]|jgi:hypothetical protein
MFWLVANVLLTANGGHLAMTAAKTGKWLMTIGIGIFVFAPPVVDILTPTHVFNADWVPHARFHTMWAILSTSAIGILALWLLWRGPALHKFGTHLAGVIGSCVLGAFMLAAATMSLYGGALSDANGVPLLAIGVDANLVTFGVALALILAGWRLAARGGD